MSNLIQNSFGDSIDALRVLFKSNKFSVEEYANSSAYLSQTGTPVDKQSTESIVKHMLNQWGVGFERADRNGAWILDSINYLSKNESVVGFLIQRSDTNWMCVRRNWEIQLNRHDWQYLEKHALINKLLSFGCPVYVVWKKWKILDEWYEKKQPFFIRGQDTNPNIRWEYEPTSCYLPQRMSYEGKDKTITKILKKWPTPCLISNGKHMLLLKPSKEGWTQETIMELDGLPIGTVSDRTTGLTLQCIENYLQSNPSEKKKIMPYMAHAVMSVAQRFGIKVDHTRLSAFQLDEEEADLLKNHEDMMYKAFESTTNG